METEFIKVLNLFLLMALIFSPLSLILREKEENVAKPFSLNLVKKLNWFGKIFILPIVAVWDLIGYISMTIIALIIHISVFMFGKKKVQKEVA